MLLEFTWSRGLYNITKSLNVLFYVDLVKKQMGFFFTGQPYLLADNLISKFVRRTTCFTSLIPIPEKVIRIFIAIHLIISGVVILFFLTP